MSTKLFQYAIIWEPTEQQKKDGKKAEVIVPVTQLLASDERAALLLVSRQIPEQYVDQLDQLNIAIRPF